MAEVRNESSFGANLRIWRRAFWSGDCQIPPLSPWIPDRVGNDPSARLRVNSPAPPLDTRSLIGVGDRLRG